MNKNDFILYPVKVSDLRFRRFVVFADRLEYSPGVYHNVSLLGLPCVLYEKSKDKIKKGDFYFNEDALRNLKVGVFKCEDENKLHKGDVKIIASSDKSDNLPMIDESVVNEYVAILNKEFEEYE